VPCPYRGLALSGGEGGLECFAEFYKRERKNDHTLIDNKLPFLNTGGKGTCVQEGLLLNETLSLGQPLINSG